MRFFLIFFAYIQIVFGVDSGCYKFNLKKILSTDATGVEVPRLDAIGLDDRFIYYDATTCCLLLLHDLSIINDWKAYLADCSKKTNLSPEAFVHLKIQNFYFSINDQLILILKNAILHDELSIRYILTLMDIITFNYIHAYGCLRNTNFLTDLLLLYKDFFFKASISLQKMHGVFRKIWDLRQERDSKTSCMEKEDTAIIFQHFTLKNVKADFDLTVARHASNGTFYFNDLETHLTEIKSLYLKKATAYFNERKKRHAAKLEKNKLKPKKYVMPKNNVKSEIKTSISSIKTAVNELNIESIEDQDDEIIQIKIALLSKLRNELNELKIKIFDNIYLKDFIKISFSNDEAKDLNFGKNLELEQAKEEEKEIADKIIESIPSISQNDNEINNINFNRKVQKKKPKSKKFEAKHEAIEWRPHKNIARIAFLISKELYKNIAYKELIEFFSHPELGLKLYGDKFKGGNNEDSFSFKFHARHGYDPKRQLQGKDIDIISKALNANKTNNSTVWKKILLMAEFHEENGNI